MSRPLRIEYPGAWYHVMNRGAGRRAIFKTDHHRHLFLELLQELADIFPVQTHAYCLMGNHYHVLFHTPEGNLARAMRHLNGVYTQRYNRDIGSDGPLFRGRYKAIVVDKDNYLLQVSRYIHRNPLEAGMTPRLNDYRWSSYPAYLGRVTPPPWLVTQTVLAMIGQRDTSRRYRAFVEQGVDEEIETFYQRKRTQAVLGDARFCRRLASRVNKTTKEIPQARRLAKRPSLEAIMQTVAKAFSVTVSDLQHSTRGRGRQNLPRMVAMMLARKQAGYGLKEIANGFGVGHYSSISVASHRLMAKMKDDARLARTVKRVEKALAEQK